MGVCRIGGETDRHNGERRPSQRYSKDSEQNSDNNEPMNTEYEYEYQSSLFCVPERVLITAKACV